MFCLSGKCAIIGECKLNLTQFSLHSPEEGKELVTKVIVEGVTEYLSTPPRNNTNNRCPS